MNAINDAYINALLADAAYVNLHADTGSNSEPLLTGEPLKNRISARLTQSQADFITSNFVVLNQELSPTGGFDAVVWRGKEGTAYEGTFDKLNELIKGGSNAMKASYEGVLDGLRRIFMGVEVTLTQPITTWRPASLAVATR